MSVILGIDAAWKQENPSGVAVVKSDGDKWLCAGIAPSFDTFIRLAEAGSYADWQESRKNDSDPKKIQKVVAVAEKLAGAPVDIVTIDMPISTIPIMGRRVADDEISRAFGGYKCSAHSPGSERPGKFGRDISEAFSCLGYGVCTSSGIIGAQNPLLEVYPHPALVRLLNLAERLEYKVSKSSKYWPGASLPARIELLRGNFKRAYIALGEHIGYLAPPGNICILDTAVTLAELKPYEDAIDALVCAWIGICYCSGKAESYGDETAAIWVPKPVNI